MTAAIYHKHPYTSDELDHIREHYSSEVPVSELAADLGRTDGAVARKAREMGLRRPCETKSVWMPRLRIFHGQGRSTAEISEATGWNAKTIRRRLRIMGLKPNKSRSRQHAALAMKAKYQGFSSWGAYLAMRKRVQAGFDWPGCKSQTEVAICRCLRECGFATAEEIAVKTGLGRACVRANALALTVDAILERTRPGPRMPYVYKLAPRMGAYHTLKIERLGRNTKP